MPAVANPPCPSDLDGDGFVTAGATQLAVASTTGLRAAQRTTDATVRVIAAGDGVSGYAERTVQFPTALPAPLTALQMPL